MLTLAMLNLMNAGHLDVSARLGGGTLVIAEMAAR